MNPKLVSILGAAIGLALAPLARGLEPWADPNLPVRDHLEVWLDASRQIAQRQAQGFRWLAEGAALEAWLDASGKRRHAVQFARDAMPRFHTGQGVAWVRFDGRDDALLIQSASLRLTNATIFLVAAPQSNEGGFRAFLAWSALGRNDYQHGLNLDLGPHGSARFDSLNVESPGAGGAANLLRAPSNFGRFRVLTVQTSPTGDGIQLFADGQAQDKRARTGSTLQGDLLTIGARYYSNTADPPYLQGYLDGNLAEVLVYSRALADAEREKVEDYLSNKYEALLSSSGAAETFNRLVPEPNPPPVQMLVPGFSVRELPVRLSNVNSLKYRPDGKLVALGYNGQIYLLSDSNEDGLEDKVETFWESSSLRSPIGLALTPPNYSLGQGAFVAAKGKVALIVDTDGDDRADREIIVAEGWSELPHGVDALGVAVDAEGQIYFGLGAADFTNAYLVDRNTGQSRFDLKSERGTILKVSPDFRRREIVCTGIRFPVALAFNREGDLFCTDQEGATWLPNGNPLDELLHIQPGRHYGFPPRHPDYLPGVIDEPSTYDYQPQHQSTCGLNFNEPVNRGPVFGPSWWAGDALVTGYSRGKLYRTKLVKTAAGYLASNTLLAALNMLTVDACVSPRGDLMIAVHSGQPDWGSGPLGPGKIYQVQYAQPDLPQPALAWAASPTETVIAFDRPLSAEQARQLAQFSAVAAGPYVEAGDRFESLRPGYQVVQQQLGEKRTALPVLSTQISADRRSFILRTPPRTQSINYAAALGGLTHETALSNALPQFPALELAYSLQGLRAAWQAEAGTNQWNGWLPHFDLAVSRALTAQSALHDSLWPSLNERGKLTLHGQLDLWQMLRPAVQPGSTIDYEWPPEKVTLRFAASRKFHLQTRTRAWDEEAVPNPNDARDLEGKDLASKLLSTDHHDLTITYRPKQGEWMDVILSLETGDDDLHLELTWHTAEDSRPRPLALHRLLLPWAAPKPTEQLLHASAHPPELAGTSWLNGRRVFFSEAAACYKCHTIRGEGRKVGPDLSNLVHRDYASVWQDITSPNAAINPDHIAYNAELKDGAEFSGVLLQENSETILLAQATGEHRAIQKSQLRSLKASTLSLMPEGIGQAVGEPALRDLMRFLLTPGLEPATLASLNPPVRSASEAAKLLETIAPPNLAPTPLRVLLVAGPKDHGPDEHDYPLWQTRWSQLFGIADHVQTTTAMGWPSAAQMQEADVMFFYSNNPGWSAARAAELDQFQKRGGGLVYLHFAVDGHQAVEALSERIGLAWRSGHSKFRHGELELIFKDPAHPITRGLEKVKFHDESYWNLIGDPRSVRVLATGMEDAEPRPLLWTKENGPGRVFVSILGHYTWTFDDPIFRLLILRGLCWAAHRPVDELSELATIGARVQAP